MDLNEACEVESILNSLSSNEEIFTEVHRLKEIFNPIIQNEKDKEFKRKRDIKSSWGKFTPHREVSKATNTLLSSISFYEEANQEIIKYQKETQDILHALELTDLDEDQLFELMKELQQIRIYRRLAKNFVELIEPLYKFACSNKELIKKLGKVQSEITKIKQTIDTRKYHVREKTVLEEAFNTADDMHERIERLQLAR